MAEEDTLPTAEEDTQFEDADGRMNGSACSFHYDDPRSVARSRSPPRRRCGSVSPQLAVAYPHQPPARPAQARSSAFGGGVLVANDHADCDAVYNCIARRIWQISNSGAALYIGIAENLSRRWSEHSEFCDDMEFLVTAPASHITASLESRLLRDVGDVFGCQNVGRGGERPSAGSHHFCYVVVRHRGLLRRGL